MEDEDALCPFAQGDLVRLSGSALAAIDRIGVSRNRSRHETVDRAVGTEAFFTDLVEAGADVFVRLPGDSKLKRVVFRR